MRVINFLFVAVIMVIVCNMLFIIGKFDTLLALLCAIVLGFYRRWLEQLCCMIFIVIWCHYIKNIGMSEFMLRYLLCDCTFFLNSSYFACLWCYTHWFIRSITIIIASFVWNGCLWFWCYITIIRISIIDIIIITIVISSEICFYNALQWLGTFLT